MSILEEIFANKCIEVGRGKEAVPEAELVRKISARLAPPDFTRALTNPSHPAPRLIAEVKRRSPSKGLLCADFDPLKLATIYAENGAAAVSVLTDERYFGGSLDDLAAIAAHLPTLPLLRKDFIFDRYQLLEACAAGASAILLIAAMLEKAALRALIAEAYALSLTPLVEVHTLAELDQAVDAGGCVIGVNNRDLHTFKVDLQTTLNLLPHFPEGAVSVAESGIQTIADAAQLAAHKVDAMLIGEGIVTAKDRAAQVRMFAQKDAADQTVSGELPSSERRGQHDG